MTGTGSALIPNDLADAIVTTDPARFTAEPGEVFVTAHTNATHHQLAFPALVDARCWADSESPRFRRTVAEAVVSWFNTGHRAALSNIVAHWSGDTVVIDSADSDDVCGYPDAEGRYTLFTTGWRWIRVPRPTRRPRPGHLTIPVNHAYALLMADGNEDADVGLVLAELLCHHIAAARNGHPGSLARGIEYRGEPSADTENRISAHELTVLRERLRYTADNLDQIPTWARHEHMREPGGPAPYRTDIRSPAPVLNDPAAPIFP